MDNQDTGIINTSVQSDTGINTEHIKMQLNHKKETTELSMKYKEKIISGLFSANFFVFIIIILVIVSGFVFMKITDVTKNDVIEYWKIILPVITTYVGYAIGKKSSE